MNRKYFVKFVSEPENDVMKTIVGIACTAKAIDDGHDVAVFFAAAGTRLLDPSYISQLNEKMGQGSNIVSQMMASIVENATLYCSFASVKATLGVNEGDGALIVEDEDNEPVETINEEAPVLCNTCSSSYSPIFTDQ